MAPMFNLMTEEVIQPLHLALAISKGDFLLSLLDQEQLDKDAVIAQLQKLESEFGLVFFVASEKARVQYLSSGREIQLIPGKVYWYFEALAVDKDVLADLGQVGDVHLYYDVKLYDEEEEFIGIVGVGKSLKVFLSRFDEFRQTYGYEFLFLNEKDDIILSSDSDLATVDEVIPHLDELPWYREIESSSLVGNSLNGIIVSHQGTQFLLSEFYIEQLDWRLILMIPLDARQTQLTQSFIINLTAVGAIFAGLLLFVFWSSSYLKKRVEQSIDTDALTGVGNRRYIYRCYSGIKHKKHSICCIIVDVDHFKQVNDTHGHAMGDIVLKQVAKTLSENIRQQDVLARWGGEEFLILLPGADANTGKRVAEYARESIEKMQITHQDKSIAVTASFGVAASLPKQTINGLVEAADTQLYKAKSNGRNCVEVE